jgi:hypothetical protein
MQARAGSFKSAGLGARGGVDDGALGLSPGAHGLSPNALLSPSNASAAFLPGLHATYRPGAASRPYAAPRTASAALAHPPPHALGVPGSLGATALLSSTRLGGPPGGPLSPPRTAGFVRPTFDSLASDPYLPPAAPVHAAPEPFGEHAPGQSLPQGLAAGYSRMHAQPAPPSVPSPAAFSPGNLGYTEWLAGSPARAAGGYGRMPPPRGPPPPGLASVGRVPSNGGRMWAGHGPGPGPLSPLAHAQPTAHADDDDVFILDH